MRDSSGMYTEIEWIKTDSANDDSAPADAKSAQALKMNGSEWQDNVAKLAAQFGSTKPGRARPRLLRASARNEGKRLDTARQLQRISPTQTR